MSERTNDGDTKAAIERVREALVYFDKRTLRSSTTNGALAALDLITTELERYRKALVRINTHGNERGYEAASSIAALALYGQDSPEEGREPELGSVMHTEHHGRRP